MSLPVPEPSLALRDTVTETPTSAPGPARPAGCCLPTAPAPPGLQQRLCWGVLAFGGTLCHPSFLGPCAALGREAEGLMWELGFLLQRVRPQAQAGQGAGGPGGHSVPFSWGLLPA